MYIFECDFIVEKVKCKRIVIKRIEGSNYYYLVRKYCKCVLVMDLIRIILYCLIFLGEILN